MDLISRHYSTRTANTVVHSTSPMRFTDGEGRAWLYLELKEDKVDVNSVSEDTLRIISQHCASPKWSINLTAPEDVVQAVLAIPAVGSLMGEDKAYMERFEYMVLEPNATSQRTAADGMSVGSWELQDGKAWFVGRFPNLAEMVKHENVWTVQREGEVGGYIVALPDSQTGRIYISDLLIFPEYRRQGLGRALLRHVLSGANSSVWLTVLCTNEGARAMYLAKGFKVERLFVMIGSK
ncbi:hypothetical protein M408DRAFT_76508 [Serendipita vermifera MAFF 305830]|uniref:N-acetyltransferase domain-containing protein n=1 Tax=Serendipita vermifera MAFF 305830 TaxID=933852 RepID=A0A0C3AVM8_SERVB|nr:hypothetical protein M408DRAFT_76508 [Serendipita vermifera MAFF 305830]